MCRTKRMERTGERTARLLAFLRSSSARPRRERRLSHFRRILEGLLGAARDGTIARRLRGGTRAAPNFAERSTCTGCALADCDNRRRRRARELGSYAFLERSSSETCDVGGRVSRDRPTRAQSPAYVSQSARAGNPAQYAR